MEITVTKQDKITNTSNELLNFKREDINCGEYDGGMQLLQDGLYAITFNINDTESVCITVDVGMD